MAILHVNTGKLSGSTCISGITQFTMDKSVQLALGSVPIYYILIGYGMMFLLAIFLRDWLPKWVTLSLIFITSFSHLAATFWSVIEHKPISGVVLLGVSSIYVALIFLGWTVRSTIESQWRIRAIADVIYEKLSSQKTIRRGDLYNHVVDELHLKRFDEKVFNVALELLEKEGVFEVSKGDEDEN